MISRREKLIKRLLSSLNIKKPNGTPGRLIYGARKIYSKKDKRRKGRVEAIIVHPTMKWSEIHDEGLEPATYWDEWTSHHDGFRYNTSSDQLYHKWRASGRDEDEIYEQNCKLRKLIKIKKARLKKKKEMQDQIENDSVTIQ